jgi:protein-disulfide isomerase
VAARNPPPGTPEQDQPPRAADKYVEDWIQATQRTLPTESAAYPKGPADAKVAITVWSDLQVPAPAEFNLALRKLMDAGANVRYTFRNYPFNQACNPNVPRTQHPHACRAAMALEAAGRVGGAEAYWNMYEWMMNHHSTFSERELQQQVLIQKLDVVAFNQAIDSPEVAAAVAEDVQAGRVMSVGQNPHGIPTIVVNGRIIPRWRLEGADVLGRILQEAAAGR